MVRDMVRHVRHIVNTGGIEVMAIGGDLDGTSHPSEIENIGQIGKLTTALKENGFSESDLEKIMYKNGARFIKDVLK